MMPQSSNTIRDFLKWESSAGLIMLFMATLAMLLKNSSLSELYMSFLMTHVQFRFGVLDLDKPLLLWVNDGLMALFFFVVGLELKHEILVGRLSKMSQVILPGIAAIGGVIVPALIYSSINWNNEPSLHGWAIPTATDIAFALMVVVLLGRQVPPSLKLFLLTLAVLDDVIAIMIIAFFYTPDLSIISMVAASIILLMLLALNLSRVTRLAPYLILGIALWVSVLKSGIHGTLAGILVAFFIPLNANLTSPEKRVRSLPKQLVKGLHPWVSFAILPIFAFMNSGVDLSHLTTEKLFDTVPLGILLGLLIGKPVGVFLFSWATIKLKLAKLPDRSTWSQLFGIALLCGIGFTMSLFIGALAFQHGGAGAERIDRLGILIGSFSAAVLGYLWLRFIAKHQTTKKGS